MNKELAEYLINYSLDTGADFSEIFYEKTIDTTILLANKKIDRVSSSLSEGVGIRLALKSEVLYAHTDIINKENLTKIIDELKANFNSEIKLKNIKLKEEINKSKFFDLTPEKKNEYLYKRDELARKTDEKVKEVFSNISDTRSTIIIASSKGRYLEEERNSSNFSCSVVAVDGNKKERGTFKYGYSTGFEYIEKLDLELEVSSAVNEALEKLNSVHIKGGRMPVVIASGSGAVIFHEACGHAMEATSVARGTSVLTGKIGQKIASKKVTIIDDGTIPGLYGTTFYDDEGNKTRKNILIENGILKSYLVDEINDRKMNHGITGSSRREDYKYSPTSRMNNTYLAPGTDNFEDMIKDIKYGLYAKKLGGGSVNPVTGDFNFSVSKGYIIRDGKICEIVKMASLIGNTSEILNNVDMVGSDLEYDTGICGSESGGVPVTLGQPTIRVSSILVGGVSND